MLPVSASTVKKFILSPSRWYFTTALAPMSLSSARTGPFNTVTVWPKVKCAKSQRERDVESGKTTDRKSVMMARAQSIMAVIGGILPPPLS